MVRNPSLATVFYTPGNVPDNTEDLGRFLRDELIKIQGAVIALSLGHIDMVNVAPIKPREGDIRLADGTNWNPGSGKGVYAYYGSAWHFLG